MLTTTIMVTKSGIGTLIGTTTTISYVNRMRIVDLMFYWVIKMLDQL